MRAPHSITFASLAIAACILMASVSYAHSSPLGHSRDDLTIPEFLTPTGPTVAPPVVKLREGERLPILSDEDLRQFSDKSFDKKEVSGKIFLLGLHNQIPVVVWYQCSDLCPQMTTRYIYYQLPEGMNCLAASGEEMTGKTAWPEDVNTLFCIPAILLR
jgi:hypothetical protein